MAGTSFILVFINGEALNWHTPIHSSSDPFHGHTNLRYSGQRES